MITAPKIRLSESAINDLKTCERMFLLNRYLTHGARRSTNSTFSFGHGWGAFVQAYGSNGGDYEKALLAAWLAYEEPDFVDENKSWERLHWTTSQILPRLDQFFSEWEVAEFEGKPAVELSFRLDVDDRYYFVGYIDLVCRHKQTGMYSVIELKHSGLQLEDLTPVFKNSSQALGYSVVLDQIAGDQAMWKVVYPVLQVKRSGWNFEWHRLEFQKTLLDRLNWFLSVKIDTEYLNLLLQYDNFPKRGKSCLQFNKPCRHFEICDLEGHDEEVEYEEDTKEYQFHYQLDDLVANHLERLT